jgi:hypothetical protein
MTITVVTVLNAPGLTLEPMRRPGVPLRPDHGSSLCTRIGMSCCSGPTSYWAGVQRLWTAWRGQSEGMVQAAPRAL